jgi:transglutaminase-like putative cysteine protease
MKPSPLPQQSQEVPLLGVDASTIWGSSIRLAKTPANPYNTDISTYQTVEIMKRLAKASAYSPSIIAAILSATGGIPQSIPSIRALARCLFYWVKGHVLFTEDEVLMYRGLGIERVDKELLIVPDALLSMPTPMGDCDDFSLLTASLLLGCGVPCSYVTIAADEETPEKFSHIYVKAYLTDEVGTIEGKPRELALDCSHGAYPGWEYQGAFRKQEWFIS